MVGSTEVRSAQAVPAREGKGDRTRRRVLDAAASLFAERGVAAVNMGDVAAAVGLQAGSLYFHFPSKAALVEEVLSRGLAEGLSFVREAVESAQADGADASQRLRVAIRSHVVALNRVSNYASVIAQAVAERGIGADRVAPPLERRYGGFWTSLTEDACAAGVLAPGLDARLVRDLLFGAMNSPTMRGRDPDAVAATLFALISHT